MASAPIDNVNGGLPTSTGQGSGNATSAFGLGFEDLLKIVLTQLTYQDPLEPMDNFQFVSQLAQFSQIQQTQAMSDALQTLVSAQSTTQAASLLGKTVEIPGGTSTLTGRVVAVAFGTEGPTISIRTANNLTINNISLGSVAQIKEAN